MKKKKPTDNIELLKRHVLETHQSIKCWIKEKDTFGYFDFDRDWEDEFIFWYEDLETGRRPKISGKYLFDVCDICEDEFTLVILQPYFHEGKAAGDFLLKEEGLTLSMFPKETCSRSNGSWMLDEEQIAELRKEYHEIFKEVFERYKKANEILEKEGRFNAAMIILEQKLTKEQLQWMDENFKKGFLDAIADTVIKYLPDRCPI